MVTNNIIVVTRVLEYIGPPEWIARTLELSKVPAQGTYNCGPNASIRSGLIHWEGEAAAASAAAAEPIPGQPFPEPENVSLTSSHVGEPKPAAEGVAWPMVPPPGGRK